MFGEKKIKSDKNCSETDVPLKKSYTISLKIYNCKNFNMPILSYGLFLKKSIIQYFYYEIQQG